MARLGKKGWGLSKSKASEPGVCRPSFHISTKSVSKFLTDPQEREASFPSCTLMVVRCAPWNLSDVVKGTGLCSKNMTAGRPPHDVGEVVPRERESGYMACRLQLESKEIKPVNIKRNQSWILCRRTGAEAEAPVLWPPDANSWLIGKDPDAG